MKKIVVLLALFALVATSCSKMARNEKIFVKAMQSEDFEISNQGLADLYDWMLKDKETMTYDFPLMREQFGMKLNTSDDGQVRCYSWVTERNGVLSTYANIIQWLSGDQMVAYSGPIDALLTGRKANIRRQWSLAHSVDTIYQIEGTNPQVYMVVESYVNELGYSFAYISAFINQGLKLSILPFFFDGIETAGNREYLDNGRDVDISKLIKWDPKERKLYTYLTADDKTILYGKYETYVLGEKQFTKLPPEQEQKTTN